MVSDILYDTPLDRVNGTQGKHAAIIAALCFLQVSRAEHELVPSCLCGAMVMAAAVWQARQQQPALH